MAAGAYWSVRNERSERDEGLVDDEEIGDYFKGCFTEEFYEVSDEEEEYEELYKDEGFYSESHVTISALLSVLHDPARAFSGPEEDFLADLPGLRANVEADMQTPQPFTNLELLGDRTSAPPAASTFMGVDISALEAWFAGGAQTPLPIADPESPLPTLQDLLYIGKTMFNMPAPRPFPSARIPIFPSPPSSPTLRELLAMGRAMFAEKETRVDSPVRAVPSPPASLRSKAARRGFDASLASLPPPPARFIARARGSE